MSCLQLSRLAEYRAVARLRAAAIAQGNLDPSDPRVRQFDALLIKQVEHTWGFNEGNMDGNDWSNAK